MMKAALAALAVAGLMAACSAPPVEVGRAAYSDLCAGCHGADGRGGMASGTARAPSDLTGIAARNGGVFDRNAVMTMIDGYFRRRDPTHPMPEFGAELGGRLVLVETGGVLTPTPEVLVGLADYLASIQAH